EHARCHGARPRREDLGDRRGPHLRHPRRRARARRARARPPSRDRPGVGLRRGQGRGRRLAHPARHRTARIPRRLSMTAAPLENASALARPLGVRLRRFALGSGRVLAILGRAIWRVIGPVLRVVTPVGWVVIGLAVLALGLSAIFAWQEFTFLGFVLLAAVLVAAFFLIGRSSYGVFVELNPRRVVVGDRAMGRMVVTNTGARKLP